MAKKDAAISNYKENFTFKKDDLYSKYLQLDSDSMVHLEDFLKALKKQVLKDYDEVVAKQNFDDYEAWSAELLSLAKKYKNSVMVEYAELIIENINSFDIEQINRLLAQFTQIVEQLEKEL